METGVLTTGYLAGSIERAFHFSRRLNFFDVILSSLIGTLFREDGRARGADIEREYEITNGKRVPRLFLFLPLRATLRVNLEQPRVSL